MSSKSKAPKNISVFLRVRPPVPREKDHTFANIQYNPTDNRIITVNKASTSKQGGPKDYVFNRVFQPSCSQKEVYEEFARPAVDAAFNGEHGVLFVYGQTGSGKTFTISNDDPDHPGVLQQALTEVWKRVRQESTQFDCRCSVSYVQLYNEILTDLLDEKRGRVRIQMGPEGAGDVVLVSESTGAAVEVPVHSYEESIGLVRTGMKRKEMTSTAMNATSSRSHTIFTFNILKTTKATSGMSSPVGKDLGKHGSPASGAQSARSVGSSAGAGGGVSARGGAPKSARGGGTDSSGGSAGCVDAEGGFDGAAKVALEGRLVLCDLAGSERVSKTHAEGKALGEATHINGSLLVLGKVVAALTEKNSQHAPFRESKLTRILQYSLLGNGNTSLVVNVSPSDDNTEETLSAIFFGQRAIQIKQDAKKHEVLDYKALYLQLLADIDSKRDNVLSNVVNEEVSLYESRIQELEQALACAKLETETLRKENDVLKGSFSPEQLRMLSYDSGVEWKTMAKKIREMYDALNEKHKTLINEHQRLALVCAETKTQLFELGKRTQHMRMQYSVDFVRFCSRIDELTAQLCAAKGTEYFSSEGGVAGGFSSPKWGAPQFPPIMSEDGAVSSPITASSSMTGSAGSENGLSATVSSAPLEMELIKAREELSTVRLEMMELRMYQRKSVQAIRFLAAENEALSIQVGMPALYSKRSSTTTPVVSARGKPSKPQKGARH